MSASLAALADTGLRSVRDRGSGDPAAPVTLVGYRAGVAQATFVLHWADRRARTATLARVREAFDVLGIDRYCAVLERQGATSHRLWAVAADRGGDHVIRVGAPDHDGIATVTPNVVPDPVVTELLDQLGTPLLPARALYIPH